MDRASFIEMLDTDLIASRDDLVVIEDSVGSTNSRAAELARDGAAEGTIVIARSQTSGRGRQGRQWVSPPDSGLYFSAILRPQLDLARVSVITLCAGVAAAKAVFATTGIKAGLKWVNDLIYDGRKLGGILAEMPSGGAASSRLEKQPIIVGIGINRHLDPATLPEELQDKVTWLSAMTDDPPQLEELAAELCIQLEDVYKRLSSGESEELDRILDEWRAHSVTLGQEIRFHQGDQEMTGTALDITDKGALIVQTDRGRIDLSGGEISIRNLDGSYC